MRVCVVGGGGREHVLAWSFQRAGHDVVVTPGNAGIPGSTDADPADVDADLVVVGPEAPLVEGLADRLRARGLLVFGPGVDGARLEGSKRWMKELLVEAGVPTARYESFADVEPAVAYLDRLDPPFVVKTDGLAAGKGVLVTDDRAEAVEDVRAKLAGRSFGGAGRTVVIEEGLTGPELSVLAVCDGRRAVPLAPAQDHKRLLDGDAGPNTGGMGAYSPVPVAGPDVVDVVMEKAVLPTLHALHARGIDYRGVLYAGLMLTPAGPRVIEYNVRFGDPEAQVVLPRLTSDLADLLASAAAGSLHGEPTFADDACVSVACSSEADRGAPGAGTPIEGLAAAAAVPGVHLFHARVAAGPEGGLVTGGHGRILHVAALGAGIGEARRRAYEGVGRISWPGMHHRTDIAAAAADPAPAPGHRA